MARPGGLELPTFWFVARRSIQLSYGRAVNKYYHRLAPSSQPRRESAFGAQFDVFRLHSSVQDYRTPLHWTHRESGSISNFSFKCAEPALKFPLLLGSLAGLEKSRARGGRFFRSWSIVRACWNNATEGIRRAPQTCAWQEAVLQAGVNHVLEVSVVEIVSLNCADVLMCQVDARNALIVCGKRHRDAGHPVHQEGMIFSAYAKNHVIACQTDFHHHVIRGHLLQERVRFILVHDVDTVTNAFRLRLLDSQANVAAQALVGNKARREFASMQGHMRLRI